MKKTVSNLSKDQELRKYSKLSDRELMMEFRTSEKGLSFEDAEQRLEEFGENKVDIQKPDAWYVVLVKSFMDPFIYVLAGLLFVSALTKDYEAVVVMSIMIVVSAVIRFIQSILVRLKEKGRQRSDLWRKLFQVILSTYQQEI